MNNTIQNVNDIHVSMTIFKPRIVAAFAAAFTSLTLLGCAPMVARAPAQLEPVASAATPAADVVLPEAVTVELATGYTRTLAAQSHWRLAGRLPQGNVYRPIGSILTIEGRQMHEAYLVVRHDALVGFYLPAETAFSPLNNFFNLPKGIFQ